MTAEYDKELNNSCFNQLPFELSEYPNQFFCSPKQVVSEIHFLNCLRNMLWPLASNWRHIPRQLENLTHKFIDFYIFVSTGVSYLDMLIRVNVPSVNFKLVYQCYSIFITSLLPNTENLSKSPTNFKSRCSFSKILLYLEKRFETYMNADHFVWQISTHRDMLEQIAKTSTTHDVQCV